MAYDVNKFLAHLFETPMPQVREVSYCCNKQCALFTTKRRGTLL